MQCYEYLAIQHYARRHLGGWTERYDDLALAEVLDDEHVETLQDVKQLERWQGVEPRRAAAGG